MEMKKAYLGFDPGSPATLALITPKGNWAAYVGDDRIASKTPKGWTNIPEAFVHFIKEWQGKTGYDFEMVIENVGPMPGEGIVSASKFVGSIWMARTACVALELPYTMVAPTV